MGTVGPTVVFDTVDLDDFHILQELGRTAEPPVNIVDADSAQLLLDELQVAFAEAAVTDAGEYEAVNVTQPTSVTRLPWIVYRETPEASVNAARSLAEAKKFLDPAQCCVLLDTVNGEQLLHTLHERFARQDQGYHFHTVCVPHIHNALFQQVRDWTRQGYSAASIQAELDERFGPYLAAGKKAKKSLVEKKLKDARKADKNANVSVHTR